MIIQDGTGAGNSAKVNKENRLHTHTINDIVEHALARTARSFEMSTGVITLTSANASALVYLLNDDDFNVTIARILVSTGLATGATAGTMCRFQFLRNPTTGTIISGGTTVIPQNRNFGSSVSIDGTFKSGVEGSTLTGGSVLKSALISQSKREEIDVGAVILPKGTAMGITIQPPASNTSMLVSVNVVFYSNNLDILP